MENNFDLLMRNNEINGDFIDIPDNMYPDPTKTIFMPLETDNMYPEYEEINELEIEDDVEYSTPISTNIVDLDKDQIEKYIPKNTVNERTKVLSNEEMDKLKEKQNITNKKYNNLTIKKFIKINSDAFLGILNDIISLLNDDMIFNFDNIRDIFMKEDRIVFIGTTLVLVTIFYVFFTR